MTCAPETKRSRIEIPNGIVMRDVLNFASPPGGPYNCCDVYIRYVIGAPPYVSSPPFGQDEVWMIFANHGTIESQVQQKSPSDLHGTFDFEGLLFSIRDVPCDGYTLRVNTQFNVANPFTVDIVTVSWWSDSPGARPLATTSFRGGEFLTKEIVVQALGAIVPPAGESAPNAKAYPCHTRVLGADMLRERDPFSVGGVPGPPVGILNVYPTALRRDAATVAVEKTHPFLCDANGNLRITLTGGTSAADLTAILAQLVSGTSKVAEQFAPLYENNGDAVASGHERPVSSANYNAVPYDVIAKANAGVIRSSAGNLYRAYFTNDHATVAQYYALLNKATTPANGDTPICYFKVPFGQTFLVEYKFGKRFTTGIAWAQVTGIAATITLAATADTVVSGEVA